MKLFETEKIKEIKKLRMSQDREWKNVVEDAEETTKELCEKYYEGKGKFTFYAIESEFFISGNCEPKSGKKCESL